LNNTQKKLRLFTTQGCHLCEQAQALVSPLLRESVFALELVEISGSDEMIERYGIRIPVVLREDRTEDLGWPFTTEMLDNYLSD
jgi:hypothetical protein